MNNVVLIFTYTLFNMRMSENEITDSLLAFRVVKSIISWHADRTLHVTKKPSEKNISVSIILLLNV